MGNDWPCGNVLSERVAPSCMVEGRGWGCDLACRFSWRWSKSSRTKVLSQIEQEYIRFGLSCQLLYQCAVQGHPSKGTTHDSNDVGTGAQGGQNSSHSLGLSTHISWGMTLDMEGSKIHRI